MRRRKPLPAIKTPPKKIIEVADFKGMNSSDHPTLLAENMLSNAQNTFIKEGILQKRGGTTSIGDDTLVSASHTEPFTATTKRDDANTTGQWTTDGSANLFTNTATFQTDAVSNGADHRQNRRVCISSNGTIVAIYNHYLAPTDVTEVYAIKSTDKGATWTKLDGTAGATTIDSNAGYYGTIWIDGSDNIHIYYDGGHADHGRFYRKLSYSAGSWTVGDSVKVCDSGGFLGSMCVTSDGVIWISFYVTSAIESTLQVRSSSNGTDWTAQSIIVTSAGTIHISHHSMILNNDEPFILYVDENAKKLKSIEYSGSTWGSPLDIDSESIYWHYISEYSVTRVADDNLWVAYSCGSGIKAKKFDGTSWGSVETLSSTLYDGWDGVNITSDGTNVWAIWDDYIGDEEKDMVYKVFNGTSWDANPTDIINDSAENGHYFTPLSISSQTVLPIIYTTPSGSDYIIKCRTIQLSGIIQSTGYDSSTGSKTYIATNTYSANGGTIAFTYADSTDNTTFSAFGAISGLTGNRYIKFKATVSTTSLASSPSITNVSISYGGASVVGSHSFTRNDGEKYFVKVVGGSAYFLESGTTWRSIHSSLTAGLRTTAAAFNDSLLITNGTDVIHRFNGKTTHGTVAMTQGDATVTGTDTHWATASDENQLAAGAAIKLFDGLWYTVSSVTSDTALELTATYAGANASGKAYEAYALPDLAGTPPVGKYITTHKNHVWVSGISATPTRVRYADYGTSTTWTAANFIDINTNDGQIVTGMASLRDVLSIGKYDSSGIKKSIHGIYGTNTADFTTRPITTEYGYVNQNAVAVTPNSIIFVDRFGLVETNLVSFGRIDRDIENIVDSINQSYIQNSTAIFHNETIFIAVPYSSATTNNYLLLYDLKKRGWTIATGLNPGLFCLYNPSGTPQLYFADQTTLGKIFLFDTGTSDNGQIIDWVIESKEYDFGDYFVKKKFKYLYAYFESTGDYDVDAYYCVDGDDTYTQLADVINMTGTKDVMKRWNLGVSGSTIKVKFRNNTGTDIIQMVKFAIVAVPKRLRSS